MTSKARLSNETWKALFRAQATIARELAASDVWAELAPQGYGVLYALSGAPDGLRITEPGDDLLLTPSGMSRLIVRLEAGGLVERIDDPEDGPVRLLARDPSKVEDLASQGVDIVRGDLDDDTRVRAAIDGISEVILVSLAIPEQELRVVAAAKDAHVDHVVKVTSKASADSPNRAAAYKPRSKPACWTPTARRGLGNQRQ